MAMEKAAELVRAYVQAGYRKIHLDASMNLGDDPSGALDIELAAKRTAELAQAAEQAFHQSGSHLTPRNALRLAFREAPRYVIGTEVPIPGGAQDHETGVQVTTVERAQQTIDQTREAFARVGLADSWERVLALVVQPGVEYGDDFILEYRSEAAQHLTQFIEGVPQLVYEAHSTDYQTRDALHRLVNDHFAILKVGPALTFAFREAVFGLAMIEDELIFDEDCSHLIQVLDAIMMGQPGFWRNYYQGGKEKQRIARKFSLSDRSRYYWAQPAVQTALERLLANLSAVDIPMTLLSQFFPRQYARIRSGLLSKEPAHIILDHIDVVLSDYGDACGC
jgi:D-tagatose-1,6-bisphosphate aldolase subunit GatZ/KbaZ